MSVYDALLGAQVRLGTKDLIANYLILIVLLSGTAVAYITVAKQGGDTNNET